VNGQRTAAFANPTFAKTLPVFVNPTFAKTLRRDKNYDVTCLRPTMAWQARRRDMGYGEPRRSEGHTGNVIGD
jgi:hypothetical protein